MKTFSTMFTSIFWLSLIASFSSQFQLLAENGVLKKVPLAEERIIGGKLAESSKYPFMVKLLRESNRGKVTCGASLLNTQFAITSASCLISVNGDEVVSIKAMLGGDFEKQDIEKGTSLIEVEEWYYKDYDKNLFTNDIAILKFSKPIKVSDAVKPICLPLAGLSYSKGVARTLGWGAINNVNYEQSTTLQEVDLEVFPDSSCQDIFKRNYQPDVMICAGSSDGSKDTCNGDSGGPLFIYDNNTDPTLIGLTSFGQGCGNPGVPAVYTKIVNFTQWIVAKAAPGGPICFGTFAK